jgi:hypothetical protein
MSPIQFTRRLNQIGISITAKETQALWKALQIDSSSTTFDDFVQFLSIDPRSLVPDVPPPLPIESIPAPLREPSPPPLRERSSPPPNTLWDIFTANRRALLVKLSDYDRTTTGYISTAQFKMICEWFRPGEEREVKVISSKYDSNGP